jgi:hypothetical protein
MDANIRLEFDDLVHRLDKAIDDIFLAESQAGFAAARVVLACAQVTI